MGKQIIEKFRILGQGASIEADQIVSIEYKEVNLSSAQIKALQSSPVELLGAPGAGKYNMIHNIILEYSAGATGYTTGFGDVLETSDNRFTADIALVIQGTSNRITAMINTGVQLSHNNAINLVCGTNPTLGTGTLKAKIWYSVETFG